MLKTIWGYIRATRGLASVMTSLLVFANFQLAGKSFTEAILPAMITFLITSATMVTSDYFDRFVDAFAAENYYQSDAKRVERLMFVINNEKGFRIYVVCLIIASIIFSLLIFCVNPFWGALTLTLCGLGFTYSMTRKIPFLPVAVVAACCAIATLFNVIDGANRTAQIILAISVLFANLGRENIKDVPNWMEDSHSTLGKKTAAVLFGTETAILIARACQVIAGILILAMPAATVSKILPAIAVIGISVSAYQLSERRLSQAKNIYDGAMALYLLGLASSVGLVKSIPVALGEMFSLNQKGGRMDNIPVKASKQSSRTVWAMMYALLALTIFCLRLVFNQGLFEAAALAIIAPITLYGLRLLPANHGYEQAPSYSRVKRMIVGMAIGLGAIGLHLLGLPLVATAMILPFIAIKFAIRGELCTLLKDQSTQLGILLIGSVILGPVYAIASFAIAYIPVILIYYAEAIRHDIPVWKPAFLG